MIVKYNHHCHGLKTTVTGKGQLSVQEKLRKIIKFFVCSNGVKKWGSPQNILETFSAISYVFDP